MTSVCDTPLAVAVRVTNCVVRTDNAVAAKLTEVEPTATVTDAGTLRTLLLLERATTVGLVAVALKETVHDSVVRMISVCVAHEILLRAGVAA
jgi:hypothetical protein